MRRSIPILIALAILIPVLLAERTLAWFIIPAALFGLLIAFIIRRWQLSSDTTPDANRPEIQIARIPVSGPMGVVFTIGTMAIFWMALPEVRWFFAFALPVGLTIALLLNLWHKHHPGT